MAKTHPLQVNFAQGELSPLMESRHDLDMHNAGLKTMLNMYADARGPSKSREGMKHMVLFDGSRARVETVYETDSSFYLYVFLSLALHIITDINNPVLETFVAPWTADQLEDIRIVPFPVDKVTYLLHPNVQSYKLYKPFIGGWDISTSSYFQSFDISAEEITPTGVFFSPDGSKMYTVGTTNDNVYEYDLSTAWNISTALFFQSFNVLAQDTIPQDIFFRSDGLKMYTVGSANDNVYEYNLSTPWDISTASYFQLFDVSGQDTSPTGIFFRADGTRMYVSGSTNANVYEYSLSTPWDISTTSYTQAVSITTQDTSPEGVFFKPDGLKMFVIGATNDRVYEYTLSVAWDISTASYLQFFSVSGQDTTPNGMFFKSDGIKMYVIGLANDSVYEYDLTSSISPTFVLEPVNFISKPSSWTGTNWPKVGVKYQSRLWLGGTPNDPEEFWGSKTNLPENMGLGTALATDAMQHSLDYAGAIQWMQEIDTLVIGTTKNEFTVIADTGLLKPGDIEAKRQSSYGSVSIPSIVVGDQLLYANAAARKIRAVNYEWRQNNWQSVDLTFPSEHITKRLIAQMAWAQDPNNLLWVRLKDGTLCCMTYERGAKLYGWHRHNTQGKVLSIASGSDGERDILILAVIRSGKISIEYLSFDYNFDSHCKDTMKVINIFFLQSFDVSTQDTNPSGMFFKPDGLKMYMIGNDSDNINEYDLSIAWNVTTASYLQLFDVSSQDLVSTGVFFKPDGSKMYIIGSANDNVYRYDLSTAWDVSSASYLQFFDVSSQDDLPNEMFFRSDGLKMYMVGVFNNNVYEYDLFTAWDVSSASYLQLFSIVSQDTFPAGLFFKPDGLKMYMMGSQNDNVYEYDLSTAWNITTASYLQLFDVSTQDTAPSGLFFKSDGLKMYIVGSGGDNVYEYDLSTAWNITTASYLQLFDVSSQDLIPMGLFFKSDGLKMYVAGTTNDNVYEYDLSTAWNITTASYLQLFDVSSQDTALTGIFFKPDGLEMYVLGSSSDNVYKYNLSAWDISTASHFQLFDVSTQDTAPSGLFFKSDGLKMYIVGSGGDNVYEYDLSTAWNITTASYLQLFDVSSQDTNPTGVFFSSDGLKMRISGVANEKVYEYDLSIAWDVSSASYLRFFDVSSQESIPQGIFFKPDESKMYIVGSGGDNIYEYDFNSLGLAYIGDCSHLEGREVQILINNSYHGTGIVGLESEPQAEDAVIGRLYIDTSTLSGLYLISWDILTSSFSQSFDISSQATTPQGMFFKPDGLKMYVVASDSNIYEYDLSTAWNISSASYLRFFDVVAQEAFPQGVFFSSDGFKMYTVGSVNKVIFRYDLSTAWDVTTASYLQLFDVTVQDTAASGVFFKPDGSKMYVVGKQNRYVYEYDLFDAWDITSASFLQFFDVFNQDITPQNIFFRADGLKMYTVGSANDNVYEYDLSTAWDVSSASYLQLFSVSGQDTLPVGVFFKFDGLKMYVVGSTNDNIYEYDLDPVEYNAEVVIGLGYNSEMETLDMDGGAPTGSAKMHKKRRNKVQIQVLDSGPPLINGRRVKDVLGDMVMDVAIPLFSGRLKDIDLNWDENATVNISQDLPYPLKVTAILGEITKDAF